MQTVRIAQAMNWIGDDFMSAEINSINHQLKYASPIIGLTVINRSIHRITFSDNPCKFAKHSLKDISSQPSCQR